MRVPEALTLDAFRRAVALRRADCTLEAIASLVATRSLDPGEAKLLVLHLTAIPGQCHRCHRTLPARSEICPTCKCVSFDFSEAEESGTNALDESTSTI